MAISRRWRGLAFVVHAGAGQRAQSKKIINNLSAQVHDAPRWAQSRALPMATKRTTRRAGRRSEGEIWAISPRSSAARRRPLAAAPRRDVGATRGRCAQGADAPRPRRPPELIPNRGRSSPRPRSPTPAASSRRARPQAGRRDVARGIVGATSSSAASRPTARRRGWTPPRLRQLSAGFHTRSRRSSATRRSPIARAPAPAAQLLVSLYEPASLSTARRPSTSRSS
jgi:hypothetical protein